MGFVNHEFNAHQGQSLRTGGHIRQEDVTKEPIKCQTVKKLHHTESFPPASRKTTRKLICLKLDSELKKKKISLEKLSSISKPHGVRDFTYILHTTYMVQKSTT